MAMSMTLTRTWWAVTAMLIDHHTIDVTLDWVAAIFVVVAGLLSVAAGIGILRFRDPLTRLHAATKPQIFGLLLIIAAVAIEQRSLMTLFALVPVFVMQSLTAPVSAHMVGRAAYRADHVDRDSLTVDEMAPVIAEAEHLDTLWPRRTDALAPTLSNEVSREDESAAEDDSPDDS
jgi:multicomponent Na+:H+ antiporter subunit G